MTASTRSHNTSISRTHRKISSSKNNRHTDDHYLHTRLPEDMFFEILGFLEVADIFSLAGVSKYFHSICQKVSTLHSGKRQLVDGDVVKLLQMFPHVIKLRLASARLLTEASLDRIPDALPNLTSLVLHSARVPESSLQKLTEGCPRLQTVWLSGCSFWSPSKITSLANLKSMVTLCLGGCRTLTDGALKTVLGSTPNLLSLMLDGCTALKSPELQSNTLHQLLMPQCSNLSEPKFKLPQLRALDVSGCRKIEDQVIHDAVKHCNRLRYLKANMCTGLSSLSLSSTRLYVLELELCSGLVSLSVKAPLLYKLGVGMCAGLQELKLKLQSISDLDLSLLPLRTLSLSAPSLFNLNLAACDHLSTLSLSVPRLRTATVCRVSRRLLHVFPPSVHLLGSNFIRKRGSMHECVRGREEGGVTETQRLAADYEKLRAEAAKVAMAAIRASGAPAPKHVPVMPAPLSAEGDGEGGGEGVEPRLSGKKRSRRGRRGGAEDDGACQPPVIAGRSLVSREEDQVAAVGRSSVRRKLERGYQSGPPTKRQLRFRSMAMSGNSGAADVNDPTTISGRRSASPNTVVRSALSF